MRSPMMIGMIGETDCADVEAHARAVRVRTRSAMALSRSTRCGSSRMICSAASAAAALAAGMLALKISARA